MHTHTVFFWLRDNLSDADHRAFQNGLDLLSRQPQIRDRRVGKPATTKRPVVDSTYSYAIVLSFDDTNGHDAYQVSAEHQTVGEYALHDLINVGDTELIFIGVEHLRAEPPEPSSAARASASPSSPALRRAVIDFI
jgi:hypothetical protein